MQYIYSHEAMSKEEEESFSKLVQAEKGAQIAERANQSTESKIPELEAIQVAAESAKQQTKENISLAAHYAHDAGQIAVAAKDKVRSSRCMHANHFLLFSTQNPKNPFLISTAIRNWRLRAFFSAFCF